jgi:hypothetical protein
LRFEPRNPIGPVCGIAGRRRVEDRAAHGIDVEVVGVAVRSAHSCPCGTARRRESDLAAAESSPVCPTARGRDPLAGVRLALDHGEEVVDRRGVVDQPAPGVRLNPRGLLRPGKVRVRRPVIAFAAIPLENGLK